MTFAEKLRQLRQEKHMTQIELAQALGISLRALVYYENGHRLPPQPLLVQMAEFFAVSTDYLVHDGQMTRHERSPYTNPTLLLRQTMAMLAGGELSDEDKDKFIFALLDVYEEARAKRRKNTPAQHS